MTEHSLGQSILSVHHELKRKLNRLSRVAVAVYDPPSDTLKTFIHSTVGQSPLSLYEAKLADVPSLQAIARSGQPRVLQNLALLRDHTSTHSRQLLKAGYHSSYTEPLQFNGQLLGFLFFDSPEQDYFNPHAVALLSTYTKLLATVVVMQFTAIRTLNGALATAREFSRHRDEETANHLRRMSYYSRSIALKVADQNGWTDEDIEYIYRFSPLHDIGKISIADNILLKPAKLTSEEFSTMQTHVDIGVEMAQLMVDEFGLNEVHHIPMLINIIGCHHERWDGNGYPHGLNGKLIPIEGRIVAVADVFDALTSERPYKKPWTVDAAFDYLELNAGGQFDPDCVAAALACRKEFTDIHDRYQDRPF